MRRTPRQIVELFHLVFTRALVAQGDTKALIALKGGCNLRFFFGSIRYSEDIDFDVVIIAKNTLENRVSRLLKAPTVATPLKTQGIIITDVSAPKQTDTTQRWKIGLRAGEAEVRTKIEFSRRDAITDTNFTVVDADRVREYNLQPFLLTHYTAPAAVTQKIQALHGRATPQARDVFDLSLLFARADTSDLQVSPTTRAKLDGAIENAMSISFDDYIAQVVAYLDPAQAELYRGRDAWNAMQNDVLSRLEHLK